MPTPQPRVLSGVERKELRRVLNSDEHVNEGPATVHAKLLHRCIYPATVSATYGELRRHVEARERPRHRGHAASKKPLADVHDKRGGDSGKKFVRSFNPDFLGESIGTLNDPGARADRKRSRRMPRSQVRTGR